ESIMSGTQTLELLAKLASGDLQARGTPTGNDDEDALITGLNMLAEELEAQNQANEVVKESLRQTIEELAMINNLHDAANRGISLPSLLNEIVNRSKDLFATENLPIIYLADHNYPGELKFQIASLSSTMVTMIEAIAGDNIPENRVPIDKLFPRGQENDSSIPQIIGSRREVTNFFKNFATSKIERQLASVILKAVKFNTLMIIPLVEAPGAITGALLIARVKTFTGQDIARGKRLSAPLSSVITRLKVELALAQNESMMSNAELLAQFGSWEVNLATQEVAWSASQHKSMGLPVGEHPTIEIFLQLVHPDDRALFNGLQEKIIKRGRPLTYEFRIIHPERGEQIFHSYADVIRNSRGKAIGLVGADQNITDLRTVTSDLRRQEQRLEQIVSNLPLFIYSCDITGKITYCSGLGMKTLKINPKDQVGKSIKDLFGAGSIMTKAFNDAARGNRISRKIMFSDAVFEMVFSPVFSEDGKITGINFVGLDVTIREELETEMTKAEKLHSIGEMAGGLAHDFNNYLTTIGMNISTAQLTENDSGQMQELLAAAAESVTRATSVTQQLMVFTRGGDPVKKAIKVDVFLREVADFALHGSSSTVEYNLPGALWSANIDRGQIEQVVDNLVLNATQAMADGGVITIAAKNITVTNAHRLGPLEAGDYVGVTISDNGKGIPKNDLDRIFQPYFTTKEAGSGLGLFSSYRILERHGGWINAKSTEGDGSTFRFYLPATREQIVKQEKIGDIITGSGNVLIMDDEESIRKVLSFALERLGYSVCVTADGRSAIEEYKSRRKSGNPFDLVILDLTIPGGLGGKDTMEKLLAYDPDIKAIVASGYAEDPVMGRYREHGFMGVMSKPFDVKKLSHIVAEVLQL
ncbi:MAG: response regulator, partial [Candidatus Marinimicrobia bacterium]|nr:response regulator [Candidatus Neomarinimicrobiota bacterium]